MTDLDRAITTFYQACATRRVPRAAVLAWPELGERLKDMVYAGQLEALKAAARRASPERQRALQGELPQLSLFTPRSDPALLTVGAGNAEHLLRLPGDFKVDMKHLVEIEEMFGGGGVNHSLRLLSAGFDVFPILPVGHDANGEQIRQLLLGAAKSGSANRRVLDYCDPNPPDAFFDPNIHTPTTTIVADGNHRTVLAQKLQNGEHFLKHIQARAEAVEQFVPEGLGGMMISHLQSDGRHISPDNPGECTSHLLERFGPDCTTLVNFGASQIDLGFDFWKRRGVFEHIDVLQLNLTEAKRFFSDNYDERRPLPSIVDKLRREQITAIITLDRFGALGVHRALTDSVIIAWPALELADVKDATGAGDAFAAGVMSYLCEHNRVTPGAFQTAIECGRIWAARACASIGAAGECPNQVGLYEFAQSLPEDKRQATEVRIPHHAREIMSLLDIAFQ